MRILYTLISGIVVLTLIAKSSTAEDKSKLVDFQQHIQPILNSQCFGCHGAKEQKGGLRIDDLESLRGYIEAGNAEASALWTDYLITDDTDNLMPPASGTSAGGLSKADLLFIKTWINEGAEGTWQAISDSKTEDSKVQIPATIVGKVWAFQGVLHPAAVHLPIALLAVSSMFVFFSFFNRDSCEPVAFHCLWIGALGAVAACVTGWSYAVYEGYGDGVGFDLAKSNLDRHRWLGVFVAAFSLMMVPLARSVRNTRDINKKVIWLLAGLILLGAVSVTGFQGGELTYGEGHYENYLMQLFPSTGVTPTTVTPNTEVTPSRVQPDPEPKLDSESTTPSASNPPTEAVAPATQATPEGESNPE